MKVGLIARAEDRGLGVMLWEAYRHLQPDRTLVVDMGPLAKGFEPHFDRYPDATIVPFDGGQLDEPAVRRWLAGLDVVYTAETPYDWRLFDWCRELGVRSVLHAMPEFWHYATQPRLPRPDVVWLPTTWRAEHIPEARLVPVPVALDRFAQRLRAEPVFLHRVGHRAMRDRAGTIALLRALKMVHGPCTVILSTQDERLPTPVQIRAGVKIEVRVRQRGDYWDGYDDASVLVGPRRYGGLSLPFNEAAAAGLGLVLADVSPNRTWHGMHVKADPGGSIRTGAGNIAAYDTNPRALAQAIDLLVCKPELIEQMSCLSISWAQAYSWDVLLPTYRAELDRAAG